MPKLEFEKASQVYDVIKELDKILISTQKCEKGDGDNDYFNNALIAIKDIDTTEIPTSTQKDIIMLIRSSLLNIYKNNIESLNQCINLDTKITESDPSKYPMIAYQENRSQNQTGVYKRNEICSGT
jgi:hypothetical protein